MTEYVLLLAKILGILIIVSPFIAGIIVYSIQQYWTEKRKFTVKKTEAFTKAFSEFVGDFSKISPLIKSQQKHDTKKEVKET